MKSLEQNNISPMANDQYQDKEKNFPCLYITTNVPAEIFGREVGDVFKIEAVVKLKRKSQGSETGFPGKDKNSDNKSVDLEFQQIEVEESVKKDKLVEKLKGLK